MTDKATQNPNYFLNSILTSMQLKNDAALARASGLSAPALSKVRHGRLRVTPAILLTLFDTTGMSIAELRALLYYSAPSAPSSPPDA